MIYYIKGVVGKAHGSLNSQNKERHMDKTGGLGWTFDTVNSAYDKMRPGYMAEVYEKIFGCIPIDRHSNVLEIGIGSGQATPPILATGCSLTAVEIGENFSRLCREKFKAYPNFSVVTGRFEDADLERSAYDLIFSATAFHWIPEAVGYPKVFSLLKSGGAFARFANHPYRDKGNPHLADAIDRLYEEYYYKFYGVDPVPLTEFSEAQARNLAGISEKYGFQDIRWAVFHRTRIFSPKEYTALLGTYSDHIAIEPGIRAEFFSKIEEAIDRHGGTLTVYDTVDLELARKP